MRLTVRSKTIFLSALYVQQTFFTLTSMAVVLISGLAVVALFELAKALGADPFSNVSMFQLVRKCLAPLKALCFSLGLGPKNRLHDISQDPHIRGIKKMLMLADYDRAEAMLLQQSDDVRHRVLINIAKADARPKFIDSWLMSRPKSPMALTLSGLNFIHLAWESRGSGLGITVTRAAADNFHSYLMLADTALTKASDISPNLADPYVALITIAKATSNTEMMSHYFINAVRCNSSHYYAHSVMVEACAEKWGGDKAEVFRIARQASASADAASPLKACVAMAHVEAWLNLNMDEREAQAKRYFLTKEI